jgi:hypothetical protein
MCALVCFITAIYDSKITECAPFVEQTISSDFICFSNNNALIANNWKVDTHTYHGDLQDHRVISKYYKMMFHHIQALRKYAVIIWIDSNVQIINRKISEYALKRLRKQKMICWHHPVHFGCLRAEVLISRKLLKYNYDMDKQYQDYLEDGYHDIHFKGLCHSSPHFGVWHTSFMAFNNKDLKTRCFLKCWFNEILKYGTNDIISFSYTCFKYGEFPYTLPDKDIHGDPNTSNQFYILYE